MNAEVEEWRAVDPIGDRYEVSNHGSVRNVKFGRAVRGFIDGYGYPAIAVRLNGKRKQLRIHHLVAKAFLPNPDDLPVVRHLNDVKTDNRIENLAWGTHQENTNDSVVNGGHTNAAKQFCPQGHEYTEENTYYNSGRRYCRTCRAAWRPSRPRFPIAA